MEKGIDPTQLHRVEDDLTETWIEKFAEVGVKALQKYVDNFQAFEIFYDDTHPEQASTDERAKEQSGDINVD